MITHIVAIQDSSSYVVEVGGQVVGIEDGPILQFQGDVVSPVYIHPNLPPSTVEEPVIEPAPPMVHHGKSIWGKLWSWIKRFI